MIAPLHDTFVVLVWGLTNGGIVVALYYTNTILYYIYYTIKLLLLQDIAFQKDWATGENKQWPSSSLLGGFTVYELSIFVTILYLSLPVCANIGCVAVC